MTAVETAISKTLCYADVFDYPLTLDEIDRYLINGTPWPHLKHQDLARFASHKNGYYFLPHREKIIALREERAVSSHRKLILARQIAAKLARIPFILGVFATGTLAMANSDKADDIDLMIVTRLNHLWTARLLVTLYLELLGIRRRPHADNSADRICANLYLDESALSLPKAKRSLYSAHEVVQTMPLINKNSIYDRFLSANRWVLTYLPNTRIPDVNLISYLLPHNSSALELLAYKLQLTYMKSKLSRETVTPHSAFFHPRDTGSLVLDKYHQKLLALS